ncbi:MAG TPA: VWA domain-containing protein [Methylomirabilota bacterium]|nr:VWA domain-containing protein [Methylomirabilota bacterium]HVN09767.1 VWA domain-containing protein [Patescibacteria group bacterium]
MRAEFLRGSAAIGLFGLLVMGGAPAEGLRAEGQSTQQKPPSAAPQQQAPVTVPGNPQGGQKPPDQYTMSVEVPLVNMEVVVADDKGDIYTGLKKGNFRISEDGVPQEITNFSTPDAPITSVLLIEFSSRGLGYYFNGASYAENAVNWADEFLRQLKKDDWVALVSFDLRTRIEVDFTQDKMAVHNYLTKMIIPGFHESNVFDALIETLDNMKDVKGRKSIVLLASGIDTFSKHNFDQTLKRVKDTDVTIYAIGVGEFLQTMRESYNPYSNNMTYLQAKNEMKVFAQLTGGMSYFPKFDGEIPTDMQAIATMLRSQYSMGYTPTNQSQDGKFRKIKVEVVGKDGQPVDLRDKKGKKLKLIVYTREGYTAPKGPVS